MQRNQEFSEQESRHETEVGPNVTAVKSARQAECSKFVLCVL